MIRPLRAVLLILFITSGHLSLSGCAAFRPIDGIPARYVPDEIKSVSRSGKKTIDLSLLSQTQPSVYRLDAGDVLAVYIEGVIPRPNEFPPVNMPQQGEEAAPALGYPIPVRQDGTISLPLLPRAVSVRGMTVKQVEDSIRKAYTIDKRILQSGNERVWVILHKPRQYRVLVIRQEGTETPNIGLNGAINLGALKRGTGRAVALTAYKNDVLHALAETGGLPGLDAENTIYILRSKRRPAATSADSWSQACPPNAGWSVAPPQPNSEPIVPTAPQESSIVPPGPQTRFRREPHGLGVQLAGLSFETSEPMGRVTPVAFQPQNGTNLPTGAIPMSPQTSDWQAGLPPMQASTDWSEMSADAWMGHSSIGEPTLANQGITKIPVRLAPGEQVQFTERDIILEDGDIVFIESRDTEIFYTGGLLGGGQYTLPRDYDLDVLGAIAIAQAGGQQQGVATRTTGGISALNNDVSISASQAVILRKMPNGTQVPIKVDLYRALRHPEERVLMQPGDYLMLQYSKMEACGAFFERHLLEGALFGVAASQFNQGR